MHRTAEVSKWYCLVFGVTVTSLFTIPTASYPSFYSRPLTAPPPLPVPPTTIFDVEDHGEVCWYYQPCPLSIFVRNDPAVPRTWHSPPEYQTCNRWLWLIKTKSYRASTVPALNPPPPRGNTPQPAESKFFYMGGGVSWAVRVEGGLSWVPGRD